MKEDKNEIYLLHEYDVKIHFKALYDCAEENNYIIKKYIILSKKAILKKAAKSFLKEKKYFLSIKELIEDIYNLISFRNLKDKIFIVGIAPYDYLLNKYSKYIKKNRAIYFTSWQYWDGENFPKGDISNKNKYEKLLKESFYGVACVTSITEQYMKKFFKNTIVVNHAINVDTYKKKDLKNLNNIKKYLFLGSFDERKNIPLILDWIKSNDLDFKFDFAGSGVLEERIIKLSEIDKRVNILGRISKDRIKNELKNYDYLVLPSKEEPFGIVLIEALAAGIPCITSNALGPIEIIKNNYNGFIFPKESNEKFDEVMKKTLYLKDEDYKIYSRNAFTSSKKYDSKILIKNWIKVIEGKNI